MTKLLVLIDGSTYSKSVCDHAAWVAGRTKASVDLLQRRHEVAAQPLARFGERHLLVAAVEQHQTQLFFQLLDLVRQG